MEMHILISSHLHQQSYRILVYYVGFLSGEVVSAEIGRRAEVTGWNGQG